MMPSNTLQTNITTTPMITNPAERNSSNTAAAFRCGHALSSVRARAAVPWDPAGRDTVR